ncbi:MAG: SDR family NAD(P)-dependent oxidoreductase [Sphingobium sp.]
MPDQLKDKVAIVTGASSGIGLATVRAFLAEGAKVVGADIKDEEGERLSRELGPSFAYLHCNVMEENDIAALVKTAVDRFGRLDIMFNNAGAAGDPASILELSTEGFDRTIALISRSVVLGHKYAGRQMIAQKSGGSIISTASLAAIQGGWSNVSYNMGKHAVAGLVKQATAELAPHGIRCNAIAPGIIPTPAMAAAFGVPATATGSFLEFVTGEIADQQPIGRTGRPEDIANAAVFFASDAASFITGQTLAVDGGATSVYQGNFPSVAQDIGNRFIAGLAPA